MLCVTDYFTCCCKFRRWRRTVLKKHFVLRGRQIPNILVWFIKKFRKLRSLSLFTKNDYSNNIVQTITISSTYSKSINETDDRRSCCEITNKGNNTPAYSQEIQAKWNWSKYTNEYWTRDAAVIVELDKRNYMEEENNLRASDNSNPVDIDLKNFAKIDRPTYY